MKSKIILLSLMLLMLTGCAENSQSEISVSQTEKIVTTEISTSTSIQTTAPTTTSTRSIQTTKQAAISTRSIQTTKQAATSTSSVQTTEQETTSTTCIQSTESDESAERQLLRDIEGSFEDTIDIMISKAEMLSERVLGEITSEEDAIEKARAVLIELGRSDLIERTESEFVELGGEKVKYQRSGKPYSVKFFDEYDAYWVMPNPPAGITEDGIKIATPAMMPYVIMRKSDGKVLGVFL